jgi:hypothetical protein
MSGYAPKGFVLDIVAMGQVFLKEFFGCSLLISFHHCSIFSYVPLEGQTLGMSVQFQKDTVSSLHNNSAHKFIILLCTK